MTVSWAEIDERIAIKYSYTIGINSENDRVPITQIMVFALKSNTLSSKMTKFADAWI